MANGLLNQLLLQQSEQTAPMQRRFNLQNFLTGATQMSNQIARQEERQRQNSLRNLIAAREQEGIGFDQLSNEAAKYDMNAANTMRDEFRNSYKFNQQQSDAELARFKREMADYWFGEVLRRARKDGKPYGELKNITYEAASMIAPYDSELAYKLLRDSENAYSAEAKRAADLAKAEMRKRAKLKDDRNKMEAAERSLLASANDENAAIDQKTREEMSRYAARIRYILNNLGSDRNYPVYDWMPSYLRGSEDGWGNALQRIRDSIDWDTFDESRMTHPYDTANIGIDKDDNDERLKNLVSGSGVKSSVNSTTSTIPEAEKSEGQTSRDYKYVIERPDAYSGGKIKDAIDDIESTAIGDIQEAYDRENIKDLEKINGALQQAQNANKGLNLKELQDTAKDHIKEIRAQAAELRSLGVASPEDKMKQFKNIFGTRASMDLIRQLRNFHAFTSGYYSNSPLTVLDNGLMVSAPQFKPTEAQYKTAKNLHNMGSWTSVKSTLKNMNVPVLSRWADYDNEYDAIFALAKDVEQQVAGVWAGLTDGLNGQQKEEMKRFFKNNFGLDDRDFAIMEGRAIFETNRDKYDANVKAKDKRRANLPTFDAEGNIVGGGNGSMSDDDILGRF
jgi:hypothetical protein